MTTEILSRLSPEAALEAARSFFVGPDRMADAWIEGESATHLTLGTFRGNLSIGAFPDPEGSGRTRIRVTTLREEGIVPRLLKHLDVHGESAPTA